MVVAAFEAAAEPAEAAEAVPRLPDVTVELVSGKKRKNIHVRYLIQSRVEKKNVGRRKNERRKCFLSSIGGYLASL